MADGKIYIIVTDQLPGGGGPLVPDRPKEKEKSDEMIGDFVKHKFFNFIESQAKQAVNYSINNIGNFIGDYVRQQHTQDAVEFLSFLGDIGTAAVVGSKYGLPGAVVAVGATLVGKGVSAGEQIIAGMAVNARQNRAINQLRTRAGLNSTNNGSRGTEY